jgi:transcriptional regulator with AAA-type ATPase domain/NAD-dependent dihydropyrimidine dehydrogenase PreA subunit
MSGPPGGVRLRRDSDAIVCRESGRTSHGAISPSVDDRDELVEAQRSSMPGPGFARDVLSALAAIDRPIAYAQRFAGGDAVVREGEPGNHFHIVVSGRAESRVDTGGKSVAVATYGEGDCVAEMSLLTGDPVSGAVVAAVETETLTIDRDGFMALMNAHPDLLRALVRLISSRVQAAALAAGALSAREQMTGFLQDERAGQYGELVGRHPALRALRPEIESHASLVAPLLIQGERGTGKELVARQVHFSGPRRDAPLLSTDCSQMAETQWGDPLFGDYHRKEGTHPRGSSHVELAEGGTLLLKNVDALPRAVQARLLRFLERESWDPDGVRRHDTRIIATSRGSLGDAVRSGHLLPALADILSARVIAVPALRDRKRDIPELAAYFAQRHAQRLNKPVPRLADQALSRLVSYDYLVANVQELGEAIDRAVILTDGDTIGDDAIFLGVVPVERPRGFNLLRLPAPVVHLIVRAVPNAARAVMAVFFAFLLYLCFVPVRGHEDLGTTLVWSVWWPMLVLSFVALGRAWCAVCPMALAGSTAQRVAGRRWRIPAWIKDHDAHIGMAGFLAIVWLEEATHMRTAPLATGLLLLSILTGALVASVLFPRRTWCRHLCPLGSFAGLCSTSAMLELRPNTDICAAQCSEHVCYKGTDAVAGCPTFQHVMFMESNQHCVLCMNCVRACPNGSPQLNLRVPAREVWSTLTARPEMGRFVAMLAGLLLAQTIIRQAEQDPSALLSGLTGASRYLALSALLALGAGVPPLGLELIRRLRPVGPDGDAVFWQKVHACIPLVTAGFVCYQFTFIPGLAGVRALLAYAPAAGGATRALSLSALSILQAGVLAVGLCVTVTALWKRGQRSAPSPLGSWIRADAASLAGVAAYAGALLALMLRPGWFGF